MNKTKNTFFILLHHLLIVIGKMRNMKQSGPSFKDTALAHRNVL